MSEKKRFVECAMEPNVNMSALCRDFGITRRTGYQLLEQFKLRGEEGLSARSKRPHYSPKRTDEVLERQIVQRRDTHPGWGAVKLRHALQQQGVTDLPSNTTINNILKRYGRICSEESEKRKPYKRFEHDHPNDLWQMDFKGHFRLCDAKRCHPLTLLDDHSRFNLKLQGCLDEQAKTVKPLLIAVFRSYGLPYGMTMDNGAPWGYSGDQLHTRLTAWLIRLGIRVYHSRPNHPQTQGKLERFHRTLKAELLSQLSFADFVHAQEAFDTWRMIYNHERPHAALDMAVPATRYQRSERVYPEEALSEIIYPDTMETRKVQQNGVIYYQGHTYRVGEGFRGDPVGLLPGDKKDTLAVYYCQQKVLLLDLTKPIE